MIGLMRGGYVGLMDRDGVGRKNDPCGGCCANRC